MDYFCEHVEDIDPCAVRSYWEYGYSTEHGFWAGRADTLEEAYRDVKREIQNLECVLSAIKKKQTSCK